MMKPLPQKNTQGGYMLIEIMVSLIIFTFVAVSSTVALLSIIDANTKAQNLKSVMDNLSVAVENMSRTARIGIDYKCIQTGDFGVYANGHYDLTSCQNGTPGISFLPQDALSTNDRVQYYFKLDGTGNGTIYRNRGGQETALTAPEVKVQDVSFYVLAASTTPGQARVFITINGIAGITGQITSSKFNIQTTVSQRQNETQ